MRHLIPPPPAAPASTAAPAQEFLHAVELDEALPDRLLQNPDGRPFEPVQIGPAPENGSLPEQFGYLMRVEPVGGAEPLIQTTRQQRYERAQAHLYQRLATTATHTGPRSFLTAVQHEVRALRERLADRLQETTQAYAQTQATLRAWQERMHRQSSGGMLRSLFGWVLGEGGTLPLPQAIALWNEREQLYLNRMALTAAVAIISQTLEDVTFFLDHHSTLAAEAQRLRDAARQRVDDAVRHPTPYEPLTLRIDVATAAARLAEQVNDSQLIADVLHRLSTSDDAPDQLACAVRDLAAHAADQLLEGHDIVHLLELETRAALPNGADPLVVIGQGLLEELLRRPTWQLLPTAQPRLETLHITPGGQPLFRLEGLSTADYGEPGDGLGFLQVQLEVALHDLRLMHDGEEAFQEALRQRNFTVLEELARVWEERLTT